MKEEISIILLSCNRKEFTRRTIEELHKRVKNHGFIRLIVVDDNSKDGTREMLEDYVDGHKVQVLVATKEHQNICQAYNSGFQHVRSEFFICMQDDVIIPELEPDVIEQLIDLLKRNPDHGGIACRIQHIPNIRWTDTELTPARKALSAYFRIQKKEDVIKMGGFGDRNWDDTSFLQRMNEINKKCSWANNLWVDHIGHMCHNKGYGDFRRPWGAADPKKWKAEYERKPYPKIDSKTNIPLVGERIYK